VFDLFDRVSVMKNGKLSGQQFAQELEGMR